MRISISRKQSKGIKLHTIFLLSALFFSFFSFFGVYRYEIYSWGWFILFYVYELLFYLGLRSSRFVWRTSTSWRSGRANRRQYELTRQGFWICFALCISSMLCFLYFIYNYSSSLGGFSFGSYTAVAFEDGRTPLEKFTLLLMQIGGNSVYLVLCLDHTDSYKKLKTLSMVCFFLPGIRYLLMGTRYTIATEFLVVFAIKWPRIKSMVNFSARARWQKRLIIILGLLLGTAFLYLFATRSIYYTALERKSFRSGDMVMKPFWRNLYERTDGGIDFLCTASDYLGEAPYVFAYYCKYLMPDGILWGQLTGRAVMQIVNTVFKIGQSYGEAIGKIAGGQYSGFAYTLIADFGITFSFIFAFLFGRWFAKIEKAEKHVAWCRAILPVLKVICFFAPIYYFYVGRLDYVIVFTIPLVPICIRRAAYDG